MRGRQSVIGTPEKMTSAQLQARVRFHESTAAMYASRGEDDAARKFAELAGEYRCEIERRFGPKAELQPEPPPAPAPPPPVPVPVPEPYCDRCRASGYLPGGNYCTCPLGLDLWRVETYRPPFRLGEENQ